MDEGPEVLEDLPFEVTGKVRLTATIVSLDLRPLERSLPYRPGQYVLLSDAEATLPPRSLSVANAPRRDGRIRLLVTRVEGGRTSTWVHDRLEPGIKVAVSGPYGTFTQELPLERPVLHLAAGSGLAPILALTEAALARDAGQPITVCFSARTSADLYDQERFAAWEACHPGFRFVRTLTRERGAPPLGRIPDLLPHLVEDLSDFAVFIAGGEGFVAACERAALALGAPRSRVHTEPFFTEPRPWGSPPGSG